MAAKKNNQTPYDVQTVAQAAARTALSEFADSAQRKEELSKLMNDTVDASFERLTGIDPTDKEAVKQFRQDMAHLRTWSEFTALVRVNGIAAGVSWLTKGLLLVIAAGVVLLFSRHLSGN